MPNRRRFLSFAWFAGLLGISPAWGQGEGEMKKRQLADEHRKKAADNRERAQKRHQEIEQHLAEIKNNKQQAEENLLDRLQDPNLTEEYDDKISAFDQKLEELKESRKGRR